MNAPVTLPKLPTVPMVECYSCDGTGKDGVAHYSDMPSERCGHCDACDGTGSVQAECDNCSALAVTTDHGTHLCLDCAIDCELVGFALPDLGAAFRGPWL